MDIDDILRKLPKDGFIKTGATPSPLPKEKKTALNRKGNQLFNEEKFEMAERIFVTTGYSDGLIRMGDHYAEIKEPLKAFKMYWLARYHKRTDPLVEKMAGIIKNWIRDTGGENPEKEEVWR
jgi:DNA-binding PadR family transcriptional regulator